MIIPSSFPDYYKTVSKVETGKNCFIVIFQDTRNPNIYTPYRGNVYGLVTEHTLTGFRNVNHPRRMLKRDRWSEYPDQVNTQNYHPKIGDTIFVENERHLLFRKTGKVVAVPDGGFLVWVEFSLGDLEVSNVRFLFSHIEISVIEEGEEQE